MVTHREKLGMVRQLGDVCESTVEIIEFRKWKCKRKLLGTQVWYLCWYIAYPTKLRRYIYILYCLLIFPKGFTTTTTTTTTTFKSRFQVLLRIFQTSNQLVNRCYQFFCCWCFNQMLYRIFAVVIVVTCRWIGRYDMHDQIRWRNMWVKTVSHANPQRHE